MLHGILIPRRDTRIQTGLLCLHFWAPQSLVEVPAQMREVEGSAEYTEFDADEVDKVDANAVLVLNV